MVDTMPQTKEIDIKEPDTNQVEKRPLEDQTESDAKKPRTYVRVKKRNFAMMLGYLGTNYYGMQRNPAMPTIEEDLIQAMFKAELIDSDAVETIQNIHFQRAARTDKGVSAVRQVVSLKLRKLPFFLYKMSIGITLLLNFLGKKY